MSEAVRDAVVDGRQLFENDGDDWPVEVVGWRAAVAMQTEMNRTMARLRLRVGDPA